MTAPAVSVVMPVYNGELYLKEAIESILSQTHTDFEFIIINDGSNDRTEEIILEYSDSRIHYINNEKNIKIAESLNKGLSLAKGYYIARMDADDIAAPNRLALQVKFMQENPEITISGAFLKIIESPEMVWQVPLKHDEIKVRMLFESCLYHPTVIFKKDEISREGGYDPSYVGVEDYDLWQRLLTLPTVRLANIPELLISYRSYIGQDRNIYKAKQRSLANEIRVRQLSLLGILPTEEERRLIEFLGSSVNVSKIKEVDLKGCELFLIKIETLNNKVAMYSQKTLKKELEYRWLKFCLQLANKSPRVGFQFLKGHYSKRDLKNIYHAIQMLWRSCKRKY